jgi:Raf kinase inhibitor-like YbhB/YbcL family protein
MAITLRSSAFDADAAIPAKHTGEGPDLSPALEWEGLPAGTKELALICDDPDAPRPIPWVHWVIYKIPATCTGLSEGIPMDQSLSTPAGALQGTTDFGRIGYGGPMPPKGHGTHHYHFKLYALDTTLGLNPGATKKELLAAIKGHVLDEGKLTGTYERK